MLRTSASKEGFNMLTTYCYSCRKYSLQSVFSESKGASCNVETEDSKIEEDVPGEKPLPLRAVFYCSSRLQGVSHDTRREGANQTSQVDAFVFRKMRICLIRHKHWRTVRDWRALWVDLWETTHRRRVACVQTYPIKGNTGETSARRLVHGYNWHY